MSNKLTDFISELTWEDLGFILDNFKDTSAVKIAVISEIYQRLDHKTQNVFYLKDFIKHRN